MDGIAENLVASAAARDHHTARVVGDQVALSGGGTADLIAAACIGHSDTVVGVPERRDVPVLVGADVVSDDDVVAAGKTDSMRTAGRDDVSVQRRSAADRVAVAARHHIDAHRSVAGRGDAVGVEPDPVAGDGVVVGGDTYAVQPEIAQDQAPDGAAIGTCIELDTGVRYAVAVELNEGLATESRLARRIDDDCVGYVDVGSGPVDCVNARARNIEVNDVGTGCVRSIVHCGNRLSERDEPIRALVAEQVADGDRSNRKWRVVYVIGRVDYEVWNIANRNGDGGEVLSEGHSVRQSIREGIRAVEAQLRCVAERTVGVEAECAGVLGADDQLCVDEIAVRVAVVFQCPANGRHIFHGAKADERRAVHRGDLRIDPGFRSSHGGDTGFVDASTPVVDAAVVLRAHRGARRVGEWSCSRREYMWGRCIERLLDSIDENLQLVRCVIDHPDDVVPCTRGDRTRRRPYGEGLKVVVRRSRVELDLVIEHGDRSARIDRRSTVVDGSRQDVELAGSGTGDIGIDPCRERYCGGAIDDGLVLSEVDPLIECVIERLCARDDTGAVVGGSVVRAIDAVGG